MEVGAKARADQIDKIHGVLVLSSSCTRLFGESGLNAELKSADPYTATFQDATETLSHSNSKVRAGAWCSCSTILFQMRRIWHYDIDNNARDEVGFVDSQIDD